VSGFNGTQGDSMAINHKYTLVCDDIRQENNGKFILIGLYMGNITVPHVPFVLPSIAFFQVFEADRLGNFTFKMRLERMDTGQALVEGMGMLSVQKPGPGVTPIKFAPVPLPMFGTYSLIVSIEGEAPIITTFDVLQALPPPQQQPQQPMGF
jgi:hypothetical protein